MPTPWEGRLGLDTLLDMYQLAASLPVATVITGFALFAIANPTVFKPGS